MSEELNQEPTEPAPKHPSQLELDLLMLFYNFADHNTGVVDMQKAQLWAHNKLGILIDAEPFTIEQFHIDYLVDAGMLPDIRPILERAAKR